MGSPHLPVDGQVQKLEREIAQLQEQSRRANMQKQVDEFKAANPDWEQHKDGMFQAWQRNPNLSPDEAYQISKYGNWKQKISEAAQKRSQHKQAPQTEMPAATPRTQAANKGTPSFKEAVQQAAQDQNFKLPEDWRE